MIISLFLILIGLLLFLLMFALDLKNEKPKLKKRTSCEYAVLIPARNESKVIENLLKSISIQADLKDTYVIVESKDDPTCKIVDSYGGNIIVRKDLTKKRKGYALDEALKEIKKKYDLYFIFDADNVLDKHFIKNLLKTYKEGYDIGIGYRNIKNSENVITSCSGLTFSMINTLLNEYRMKINKTITVSGTGYFISGELIEKWGGFPFHTLTENYELSLYATANNLNTCYNANAVFYDEQPTKLKVSISQRTRWVKGFLESRNLRLKDVTADVSKIIGITPYLFIIGGLLLLLLISIGVTIRNMVIGINYRLYFNLSLSIILGVYLLLVLFTLILLIKEGNKLNISFIEKVKAAFFNPIFLSTYVICLIKAITTDVSWDRIEHTGKTKKAS